MEQRKQGKVGSPFFLLTFSLAKQRKVSRHRRNPILITEEEFSIKKQ
ncbi:hypothetical protein CGSHiAA_06999 [Haemophilus influenzae PittAA]|nr:hypothetical protein CGSHiAA_06999 [Haemophilus influenzae PittAA]